jgi:hypothetical protein
VSVQTFDEIYKERESRGRAFRFRSFSAESKILIVIIPTALHEQLHLAIDKKIFLSMVRMGLDDTDWISMGSTTLRAQGHPNGDGGEGDSTGGPRNLRGGEGAWPTLVIEAGVSETLEELRNDMKWWFGTSDHQVQIVLLAKFDHNQNQIILEKWIEVQTLPRPGATTTRAAQRCPQLIPDCSQVITIARNPGIADADPNRFQPMSYTVTRGDLRLEFDRLFLREPDQAEGEGDIVISTQDLQSYAGWVWQQRRAVS